MLMDLLRVTKSWLCLVTMIVFTVIISEIKRRQRRGHNAGNRELHVGNLKVVHFPLSHMENLSFLDVTNFRYPSLLLMAYSFFFPFLQNDMMRV